MSEYLLLLKDNWNKFTPWLNNRQRDIVEQLLDLVRSGNRKIKEQASDTLEAFIQYCSEGELQGQQNFSNYFVTKVKSIVNCLESDPVEVMVCIRCFGYLGAMVRRTHGQEELKKHFLLLFEISQSKVMSDITDNYKLTGGDGEAVLPENFKKILYRQKQLNSHIKAFALIVKEMDVVQDTHAKHLLDLFMVGVKKHKLFFEGYKKYLYLALVHMVNSMSVHEEVFKFWIKKAVGESIASFVEVGPEERDYDRNIASSKSAGEFIVKLLKQEIWVPTVKQEFERVLMTGFIGFLQASDLGYEEILDQGKILYIPANHDDHHRAVKFSLILEEIQRMEVLDQSLCDHFPDLLTLVTKLAIQYPRTTAIQKLFRTLLSISERLQDKLLKESPENCDTIEQMLEHQFNILKELRGDILMDHLRCLLYVPTHMLSRSLKLREMYRRSVHITLEIAGPNTLFMIDHVVSSLERTLAKDKVDLQDSRDKFLQDILPFFENLLQVEFESKGNEEMYTLTVQESQLDKDQVLRKLINFLGSLGTDLLYIAKGLKKDLDLEHTEADNLKISIPICKYRIEISLNQVIRRASELALESPNKDIQNAACELFHASITILIGKCSQGAQPGEDFVLAFENSLPSVFKIATNTSKFSTLFRELLFQMSRWLSLNKDDDNPLVSTFIGSILTLAGVGDKPELRALCLQVLEQFLMSTIKSHALSRIHVTNFGIFFRKVEGLSLHPDPYKRLAGMMSLKLVAGQLVHSETLIQNLFFEVVFYFLAFLRKHELKRTADAVLEDSARYCQEIYVLIEGTLKSKAEKIDSSDHDRSKFSSVNDLFQTLQKNLFSPETLLREYSVRLWLVIRSNLQSLISVSALQNSMSFLEDRFLNQTDDMVLSLRDFISRCATLSELLAKGAVHEKHLREGAVFTEIVDGAERLLCLNIQGTEGLDVLQREAVMKIFELAGQIKTDDREKLLKSVRSPGLVRSVISAAFSSKDGAKDIQLSKNVMDVLRIDRGNAVKDFVNSHEYRFDSGKDMIYSLSLRIPLKSLESFFNTILALLGPQVTKQELLNSVRIYHMLKFVKAVKKNAPADIISRAKVFLQFLLATNSLEDKDIAEFLDPFKVVHDNFAPVVQNHINKIPEEESAALIGHLFQVTKKDHNFFTSILDLLSLFVSQGKKTDSFFASFNTSFDPAYIRTHEYQLKDILNLGAIFLQEKRVLNDEQVGCLLGCALNPQNRESFGMLALDFLGHYARAQTHENTLLMFRQVKQLICEYSRNILPVIFEEKYSRGKDGEKIMQFATRIFEFIKSSLILEPLEAVFPLIRNKKWFRTEILGIIERIAAENKYDLILSNLRFCLDIFEDRELSQSLEYNVRFSIVDRVMLPLVEAAKEEFLKELFIELYPRLDKVLATDLPKDINPRDKILLLAEKTCAYKFFELFFRKLTPYSIKEIIHPRIIGPQSQRNEITKKLIQYCRPVGTEKRTEVEAAVLKYLEMDNSTHQWLVAKETIFDHYCSIYNCLVSVFLNTQTKEQVFIKFLLSSEPKADTLLSDLVDLEESYNFKVSTNFRDESIGNYYRQEDQESQSDGMRAGLREFVVNLTADSLFTQTLTRGRLAAFQDPATQRQQLLNILQYSQDMSVDPEVSHARMDIEQPAKSGPGKLEMDLVNRHPIMKSMMRLIDFLDSNFKSPEGSDALPTWMQQFRTLFTEHTALNQRILLLKVITNRSEVFKPYRDHFTQYLLEYMSAEKTGGVGFHYFMRDVAHTLLIWYRDIEAISITASPALLKKLCCDTIKSLCKKLADESRPLFILNVDFFQGLCHIMRKVLVIDSAFVFTMLTYTEKKLPVVNSVENKVPSPASSVMERPKPADPDDISNTSVLWRLVALTIVETAITKGIEFGSIDQRDAAASGSNSSGTTSRIISDESRSFTNILQRGFTNNQPMTMHQEMPFTSQLSMQLDIEISNIVVLHEKILKAIMFNMRAAKKRALCTAAFRLAGIYLNYLYNNLPSAQSVFDIVQNEVINVITSMVQKRDNRNLEYCICELSLVFPEIVLVPIISSEITGFIVTTVGKTRGYIFSSVRSVIARSFEKPALFSDITPVLVFSLKSSLNNTLRDTDPENIKQFLLLLIQIAKLKSKEVVTFLSECLAQICETSLALIKSTDMVCFFDLIVLIIEQYSTNLIIQQICKKYLVLGLSNSDENVRRLFFEYLNQGSKMIANEEEMLTFILMDLYSRDYEQFWLTTSAQMIMSLSKTSPQASKAIFDNPLQGYVSSGLMSISNRLRFATQMSQPLIPYSLIGSTQQMQQQQAVTPQPALQHAASAQVSQLDGMSVQPSKASLNYELREHAFKSKIKYEDQGTDTNGPKQEISDEPYSALFGTGQAQEEAPTVYSSMIASHSLMKALKPEKRGTHTHQLKSFFRANDVSFNQFSQIDNNKVRFLEVQGMIKKPDMRTMMTSHKNIESSFSQRTLREYKLGDLPDIQIKFSDLLKPLEVLAAHDPKISQMLFVSLFVEIHKHQTAMMNQINFKHLLRIIDESQSNYQVINTVQNILYELSLGSHQIEIDPSLVCKTGTGSLSFGGAALLLEDMLAKSQRTPRDPNMEPRLTRPFHENPTVRPTEPDDEKFRVEIDTPEAVSLALNLIEIYKQINDEDTLRGLYRQLHAHDKAANDVFDLKMGKKTTLCLKKLEELIHPAEPETADRELYMNYLKQEKRENLYALNKWKDLVEDAYQEPSYSKCFETKTDKEGQPLKVLTNISKIRRNERFMLIRGMLYDDSNWECFRESVEIMVGQSHTKSLLEKDHPYELSLLSVAMLEFDRSKFYLEKFKEKFLKSWNGVKDFGSLQTKTEVISELLRQHELKEFLYCTKHFHLEGMVGCPDLDKFVDTLNLWTKRKSMASWDNFNYMSDSYHARSLFIDIMKGRYGAQYNDVQFNKQRIKVGLDYCQGLLGMGMIDTAEKVLNQCYSRKMKHLSDDGSLDYEFASLIIKSRLDGIDRDINFVSRLMDESNINAKFLNSRFAKVNQVMDFWMSRKETEQVNFIEGLKFSLLKLKTKCKEIAAIRDYLGPASNRTDAEELYLQTVNDTIPIVQTKIELLRERSQTTFIEDESEGDEFKLIKAKILKKGCDIHENILRWFKSKADLQNIPLSRLENKQYLLEHAMNLLQYHADLVSLDSHSESRTLFVLEVVAEFSTELGNQFNERYLKVPCWIFIRWIPQIMSFMKFDRGAGFLPLVERLVKHYPEPMIYSLSVATDDATDFYTTQETSSTERNTKRLKDIIDKYYPRDCTHLKFIRSMEYLLHPEQRLKVWIDCFEENLGKPERMVTIKDLMEKDVFNLHDELLGEKIGEFNKRFIKEMDRHIFAAFGNKFSNLPNMKKDQIAKSLMELYTKADGFSKSSSIAQLSSSYKTKLSAFSGWLSEYDINDYRRHSMRIEVPGQYGGDREPIPDLHVKVSYFLPELLVIQSIRKPKRLTMIGTDEKLYHSLVKGGEDLRLDQRIEQLFSLMNEIFSKDTECAKRDFNIGTFNVIPVKRNLGVMEWVKNTIPLKSVIEREMSEGHILDNNAYIKRNGLLKLLAKGKDVREQHLALLGAPRDVVVKDFKIQLRYFKSTYLKDSIKKRVQNAEQFIRLRRAFLRNYAVLSLACYILGVGDRHLDNFLFESHQGKIIPIDFGYSFGFGVGLCIPELMPFRLTQNLMEMNFPIGIGGLFRNSMVPAMKSLKSKRRLLTDCCEVFIREPLMDWLKISKMKSESKNSQQLEQDTISYPRDRLRILEMKLSSFNPVTIMLKELEISRHANAPYYQQIVSSVKGADHTFRAPFGGDIISVCDQMDILIDMASDPDILGRTWTGWAPYA